MKLKLLTTLALTIALTSTLSANITTPATEVVDPDNNQYVCVSIQTLNKGVWLEVLENTVINIHQTSKDTVVFYGVTFKYEYSDADYKAYKNNKTYITINEDYFPTIVILDVKNKTGIDYECSRK